MKTFRLLTCLLPLLYLQKNIYCQHLDSQQLQEYLMLAGRPTMIQHFSTSGVNINQDYSKSGSQILDFVTLNKDSKSTFSSKGRF